MSNRENDVCMVYDDHGNAFHYFDYTAEALEAEALKLRRERGEVSTVTIGPWREFNAALAGGARAAQEDK
jgi:hypothetical protein